jgi:heptosyltransferase-2
MRRLSKRKEFLLSLIEPVGRIISFFYRLLVTNPMNIDLRGVQNILVLELWGIGDLVMVTPVLRTIRKAFPHAHITLLARPHAELLLQESSLVDEIIVYDFPWTAFSGKYRLWRYNFRELFALLWKLKKKKFDLSICARMDIRNNFLMFLTGAKRRVGYRYGGGSYFLTDAVVPDPNLPHRVDQWRNLLKRLTVSVDDFRPRLYSTTDERKRAESTLFAAGVRQDDLLIGIHPGARVPVRRWELDRFAAVGDALFERYHAKVLVFVDPEGYGRDIPMQNPPIIVRPSLRELMALIEQCDLLICNDSGPMHLGVALETPVVAVFGPTEPQWFGPYGDQHRIVIQENFPCRPCFDHCVFDHPYCIKNITAEQVLAEITKKIARSKSASITHV